MNPGPGVESGKGEPFAAGRGRECPACGAGNSSFETIGSDRLFRLAEGTFRLFRCLRCRSLFQHPLPEAKDLAAFYPKQYWWSAASAQAGGMKRLLERAERFYRELVNRGHVRFLLRCAANHAGRNRSLLDIGCGSGLFLHLASRKGFDAHGLDVSGTAVGAARAQYGLDVRQGEIGGGTWNDRRFDFVTMFHVLEHLGDPAGALAWVDGLLNPGGRLIVQVPNAGSLQARLFGRSWYGLDVPRHVVNFTPEALDLLLARCGYRVRAKARFSLRDNPASIASSVAPFLDPIGLHGRGSITSAPLQAVLESAYLGLFLLALPLALLESALGCGGTLWVEAARVDG